MDPYPKSTSIVSYTSPFSAYNKICYFYYSLQFVSRKKSEKNENIIKQLKAGGCL